MRLFQLAVFGPDRITSEMAAGSGKLDLAKSLETLVRKAIAPRRAFGHKPKKGPSASVSTGGKTGNKGDIHDLHRHGSMYQM